MKIQKKFPILGSSQDPEQLALTVKGVLLTLIPVVVLIAAGLHVTLDPNDLASFVNTLLGVVTTCITLFGIGRKIVTAFKN